MFASLRKSLTRWWLTRRIKHRNERIEDLREYLLDRCKPSWAPVIAADISILIDKNSADMRRIAAL